MSAMRKIVLASSSPRRRDILNMMGWKFEIIPSNVEEEVFVSESPSKMVCRLAYEKAKNVFDRIEEEDLYVLGADTIVVMDGKVLGKPASKAESFSMIKALSGREHEVYTGVSIIGSERSLSSYERTFVKFRDLSIEDIKSYVKTEEGMDKAGSYGLQGLGAIMIESIRGDYYNVVGFPICKVAAMLEDLGCSMSQMWGK